MNGGNMSGLPTNLKVQSSRREEFRTRIQNHRSTHGWRHLTGLLLCDQRVLGVAANVDS